MRKPIIFLLTLFVILSCNRKQCEINPEIAKIKVDIKAERLEKPFFQARTEADIRGFLRANQSFAQKYLQVAQYPDEATLVSSLVKMNQEPNLQKFAGEVEQKIGNITAVENDLETGFKHLKYYYPNTTVPAVKTFISGLLGPDLLVSDSLVVLGIDYFAGKEASYRPQQPEYILKRYEKPYMVPAVLLQLSAKYNKTLPERSMLAQMIDFGKSFYFTQRMLPCTPDSLIIGYTDQEIADVRFNEGKIWAHFIEKSLLYETNHFRTTKYIGERPNIPEIGKNCPGRIATWVGWQIVRKYMDENPAVTLQQLMQETDAQKIFTQSRYKPKRR